MPLWLCGGRGARACHTAAGLLRYYRGSELVLLNKAPTSADRMATLILRDPIGQVLDDGQG